LEVEAMVERAVKGFLAAHSGGMAPFGSATRIPPLDAREGEGSMLRSMKELEGYAIHATDGTIGHVRDFYFDDEAWVIRYFVVDTGAWLRSRKVLISPIAIGHSKPNERAQMVSLTKAQVRDSPDIDTELPVSRQHEVRHLRYYGYPYYWGGTGLWGGVDDPSMMLMAGYDGFVPTPNGRQTEDEKVIAAAEAARHQNDDPHLRSCKAVIGYHIEATDGGIGHVQGMLVDEDSWAIRYLVADASNWWLGHEVLIAPQRIRSVSWSGKTVSVDLTRQAVKDAPPYDLQGLDRILETNVGEALRTLRPSDRRERESMNPMLKPKS
jgi:uncharacterized protein YrrD